MEIAAKTRIAIGATLALGLLFGIPAVLVRVSMENVPDRSMVKVISVYDDAVDIVNASFSRHRAAHYPGRLMPLPQNSHDWIVMINPMGRKAPGGGPALLPEANDRTGTIGVSGDAMSVTITMPHYRQLKTTRTVITARSGIIEGEP